MTEEHDSGYDPYNSVTTRKVPPVPAWLQNDAEIVALARVMVESWRAHHPSIVRLWAGKGVQVQNLARYRK